MMATLTRQIRPTLRVITRAKFELAKEWFLESIAEHELSRDLNSHAPSPRLDSDTGTLFGFFGFEQGSDPVGALVDFYDREIKYIETPSARGLYSAKVVIPSKAALNSVKELCPEWIGLAWPIMMEDGVTGLNHYINKYWANSVSGEGFQSKSEVKSREFKGVGDTFLKPLFSQFRQRLLLK